MVLAVEHDSGLMLQVFVAYSGGTWVANHMHFTALLGC
jgi:hypothetical protein